MVILEMGLPEWVESDTHHKPTDVEAIASTHPSVEFVITHTFVDTPGIQPVPTVTDVYPIHPTNVHHAEDGLRIKRNEEIWTVGV
jgi:predicted TIM-barrel fold metal-dependent hydrolase